MWGMVDWQRMVKDWHKDMGLNAGEQPMNHTRRAMLVESEMKELAEALREGDLAHIVHELCDVIWVCLGTAVELGLDLTPFFLEVRRANYTKKGAEVIDGKLMKGSRYEPPAIQYMLDKGLGRE